MNQFFESLYDTALKDSNIKLTSLQTSEPYLVLYDPLHHLAANSVPFQWVPKEGEKDFVFLTIINQYFWPVFPNELIVMKHSTKLIMNTPQGYPQQPQVQ